MLVDMIVLLAQTVLLLVLPASVDYAIIPNLGLPL